MGKEKQEITDKIILEEILSKAKICRIAMIDNDAPYILPFNYGYKDNCIYIHCAQQGKKIDILKNNPKVGFELECSVNITSAEKPCKWATTFRSIVGQGQVNFITDFSEKKKGLEIIMAHHGAPKAIDFDDKMVKAVLILKLEITNMTGKQSNNYNPYS